MVDAISAVGFNALTYLSQVKGIKPVTPVNTAPAQTDASETAPATTATAATPATPSSLTDLLGLSSDVLSLLQGSSPSSSSGDLLSSLVSGSGGNISSSDPLYSLLSNSTTDSYQNAIDALQQQQADTQAQSNPVQNVLASYTSASNAYNQTLQQTAQSILAANNFQADGTAPLVA